VLFPPNFFDAVFVRGRPGDGQAVARETGGRRAAGAAPGLNLGRIGVIGGPQAYAALGDALPVGQSFGKAHRQIGRSARDLRQPAGFPDVRLSGARLVGTFLPVPSWPRYRRNALRLLAIRKRERSMNAHERPIVTEGNKTALRAGSTGNNVRYVLIGSVALALLAWILVEYFVRP
jgi:hypothetical protein